jgi:hypothetical protein
MPDTQRPIALIDVEASGGKPMCYPIEVAHGFLGSEIIESHLLRPAATWTTDSDRWQSHAYEIHKIKHTTLIAEGEDLRHVAERLNDVLAGADVYSDDHQDARWLTRLFDEVGMIAAFEMRPIGELFSRLGGSHVLVEAKVLAKSRCPKTHRAAGDVRHLLAEIAAVRELTGTTTIKSAAAVRLVPKAAVLRKLTRHRAKNHAIDILCARAIEIEAILNDGEGPHPTEALLYTEIIQILDRIRARFDDEARERGIAERASAERSQSA